jgi:hypothetical protein
MACSLIGIPPTASNSNQARKHEDISRQFICYLELPNLVLGVLSTIKRISGMVECKEFVGRVVRSFTIYEDNSDGPEICIEFIDGTVFSSRLETSTSLEARMTRDEGTTRVQGCEESSLVICAARDGKPPSLISWLKMRQREPMLVSPSTLIPFRLCQLSETGQFNVMGRTVNRFIGLNCFRNS